MNALRRFTAYIQNNEKWENHELLRILKHISKIRKNSRFSEILKFIKIRILELEYSGVHCTRKRKASPRRRSSVLARGSRRTKEDL